MSSGRKESVRRHIENQNIHMGHGTVIPFPDSLLARLAGTYVSNPAEMGMYNKRNDRFFAKTPEKMFAMFEKAFSQKMADKIADNVVYSTLAGQNQPTYYNYNITNVNYYYDFFTKRELVYALEMQVCPKCLTIEPAKIGYKEGENSAGIRIRIDLPCSPPPGYIPESQQGQYLRVIAEDGVRRCLRKWLDSIIPTPKERRIVAIPVPQLSPSNSRCAVRLWVIDPGSDPIRKKYVTIQYLKEKCHDLLLPSDTEPRYWSTRVLQNGNTTIGNDVEIMDYLSCTNHSTYGFFRIKPKNPFNRSMRVPSGSIYLIMLLVDNNLIPAIDNVFYDE